MCVDYTDLNNHCPKDPFPLPCIDHVVDSMAGCVLLSFLDCYSGYHQIALKESDQEKTSFITPFGTYCYNTMTFGLKNAGATYQKAIQRCLQGQIVHNAEAYVDDIVVKTKRNDQFIMDLSETFENLRKFKWKLNPIKCVFGIPSGKLLGFQMHRVSCSNEMVPNAPKHYETHQNMSLGSDGVDRGFVAKNSYATLWLELLHKFQ